MILLTFAIGRNLSCSLNELSILLLSLCPPDSLSESAIDILSILFLKLFLMIFRVPSVYRKQTLYLTR
ncbi:hypothetical protein RND71_024139 [Anisodus tanguticus]|uniref:Uncharacterized protein n=1 Tax=Anisodus tanguticus TaxID=243964 RepID=A0AAE1RNY0_9SOLA|nr:hypothetical protein RND71_024139 [Anisodus tanguticus]